MITSAQRKVELEAEIKATTDVTEPLRAARDKFVQDHDNERKRLNDELKQAEEGLFDLRNVYIGEQQDRYEHHRAQLEILRGLYARDEKIAIGMEMFQRPFEGVLDAYIEGNIDEKEFLKSTEYFKRWGFDYNLYKDILRFARDEGIPVVALNIRREVIDKVSKEGLDALTEEERKELPGSMDMTDDAYSRRLKEVFLMHRGGEGRSFENFYQSQIIWAEIMAQSLEEYLSKNPDRRVAVLAGGGHLAFSSGIPRRL